MFTSIPVRADGATLKAAECALMRWWPRASLAMIQQVRKFQPSYPLLAGGKGGAA